MIQIYCVFTKDCINQTKNILKIIPYFISVPYIYIYIYSPTPVGLSSLANEVIVLPLAFIARLFIYDLSSR